MSHRETIDYPDGSSLEIAVSGNVNGPDQVGGLHHGTSYIYLRIPGREWRKSFHRSRHRTRIAAEACKNAVEAYVCVGESSDGRVPIRCPDCGYVEVVPDTFDRGIPASGECPGCGDRLYFDV